MRFEPAYNGGVKKSALQIQHIIIMSKEINSKIRPQEKLQ